MAIRRFRPARSASDAERAAGHGALYLQALLDRDARQARVVVEAAVADGVPVPDVYADIFEPALREIGHRWAMNELNVAQEHFATTVTQSLLATLGPRIRVQPTEGRLAIVTGAPDELHQLGVQIVSDLLEAEGWEVLNLGAATPADDLIELVAMECPDVVALSASTAGRLPALADVVPRLAAIRPRPYIVVGGGLFSGQAGELATELGADLVASDARALVRVLRERFGVPEVEREERG